MTKGEYDCSFMSVIRCLKEVNLCEKPYMKGAHMGPLANMLIYRKLYKRYMKLIHRIQEKMEVRVPHFRAYQARERTLDKNLTRYDTVHNLLN